MKKLGAETEFIQIRGARVHNLKNIDLDLPIKKLVCFAGPSGSGKTSIAFHTLLTESKRRFVNSFPNSMKFFAERPAAVDVESIFPVLPVFGLPQINPIVGSREVVRDLMSDTDALQTLLVIFSRERYATHNCELEVMSIESQFRSELNGEAGEVFYVLVSPPEVQRVMGEGFLPPRSFSKRAKKV